ncbi:MAG TPA: ABC transporter substrate-binding protein [Thermodesulfobacteriota bacterium]|nr:ABC transporter substrate-binding protein [Thermodesulfobacteriota bacterium]
MKRTLILGVFFCFILTTFFFPQIADAQKKPILVGFPMILSGGGALFGQPAKVGAEMAVKEINEKGGLLGQPIELLVRDCKSTPDEATRVARELIAKENVQFLVGGLTAAQGLALSEVGKTEKILYIAPISKSTAMTEPGKLHPYVFRAAANTNTEGRSAAVFMAKNPWKKVYTLGPDYEFGQMVTKAFVEWIKKIKPEVEIIGQGWPKLGEADYTPFITALMGAKPEAAFLSLWGGDFVNFAKQAKPYGFFEKVNVVAAGEGGSPETAIALKDDLPLGITTNAYDLFYYPNTPEHLAYEDRLKAYTKEQYPPSWAITGYISMYFLADAIKKANSTDTMKVIKALEGLTIDTPIGKQTMRAKDHQANRGQFWGTTAKVSEYPFPILRPVEYIPADNLMD